MGSGRIMALMLALALGAATAFAAATSFTLPYAGRLSDSQGQPVAGPVTIEVTFYRSVSGGEALNTRALRFDDVPLLHGLFQINIVLAAEDPPDQHRDRC